MDDPLCSWVHAGVRPWSLQNWFNRPPGTPVPLERSKVQGACCGAHDRIVPYLHQGTDCFLHPLQNARSRTLFYDRRRPSLWRIGDRPTTDGSSQASSIFSKNRESAASKLSRYFYGASWDGISYIPKNIPEMSGYWTTYSRAWLLLETSLDRFYTWRNWKKEGRNWSHFLRIQLNCQIHCEALQPLQVTDPLTSTRSASVLSWEGWSAFLIWTGVFQGPR